MDEKSFVNEVRGFLFYSSLIWPAHRLLAKKLITPRCRRCIVSANYSPLNKERLCEICQKELSTGGNKNDAPVDQSLIAQIENEIASFAGKGLAQFDAVILFSGGKDSCYMVKRITQAFPQLRVVLLTIDNTFMSPIAEKNMHTLVRKFQLPHIVVRPPESLYNKMFRHAFLHLNEKGCSGTVDQFDGDLFHDIARNYAAMNKIPLILSGCSRTQVERILNLKHFEFERDFEESKRESVAGIRLRDIFNQEEMKYWMGHDQVSVRPRLLFPFYAWNLDESEILNKVTEWGLILKSSRNPLLTNNRLIPLMAMVDMVKYGYSSFEPEFCQMVRQGKADGKFWQNVFELSEYAARTGRFVSQSVDLNLRRLSLTREQLGLPK